MFCPKCGASVNADNAFCGNCGAKLASQPAPTADYVPKHASPEPARPSAAPTPVWDNVQQAAAVAEAPRQPANVAPRKKKDHAALAKNPKVWGMVGAGIALVLVIALVIGMLSSLGGPLVKIAAAAQKTLNAGNFTLDYEVEIDGQNVEGTLFMDLDAKKRTVSAYTVLDMGYEMTVGIYDGTVFGLYDYSGYTFGFTQDIEDALDEIFDAYEESGSSDLGELLEQIEELMYETTGEELSDYMDMEELEKSLKAYGKAVSREKWLKTNAGYSKTSKNGETLYTFEPSLYDFLMASLPYFEDAFEDSDVYEDMMDYLDDVGDDMDDEFAVGCTIGVKSGYLSSVTAVMEMDGEELEMSLKLYDINKTKLDPAELEDLLDDAERYS